MSQPHEVHKSKPETAKPQRPQAIAGPFTLRDLVVGGSALVLLIGSLIPYFVGSFDSQNMWNTLPLFFLGIGVLLPLAVAALFAGRRLSPTSRIRLGSLSLDQFASVVAVIAVAFFFLQTASAFTAAYLVGLIGALGLLAATTFARFIPPFAPDFAGRKDAPAHVTAREGIAPTPKPAKPASPVAAPQSQDRPSVPSSSGRSGEGASRFARPAAGAAVGAVVGGSASVGGADAASTTAPAETAGVGDGPAQEVGAGAVENGKGYTESSVVPGEAGKNQATAAPANAAAKESASTNEKAATGKSSDTKASDSKASVGQKPAEPAEAPEPAVTATAVHPVVKDEPISATRENDEDEAGAVDAFWFAVGSNRPVIDESTGKEIFIFEPGDWELCLEDRGHEFVVQNKHTGQTGIMKDLSDIQIPPSEDHGSRN